MSKVVILTDSTCDLSEKLIKENNIEKIPLYVSFNGEMYKDGIDIESSKLYDMVKEKRCLPKTAACSVGDFINVFSKYLNEGYDVYYMGIGSKLSGTYNNALLAKEELATDRVQIGDSLNLSTGTGLQLLIACKLAKEGKSVKEIKDEMEKVSSKVRSMFAVESLEYLHKGGRCSGVARFFGTMARLKPVIEVKDGKLDVFAKPIGKRKALQVMLDDIIANKDNIRKDCVMVTHTYADEEAKYLKDTLNQLIPDANVEITDAGCVISAHCGKGTIGILYVLN